MATRIVLYDFEGTVTATTTGTDGWINVGQFRYITMGVKIGAVSGTNPRLEAKIQFADRDDQSTGLEPAEGMLDFHDKSDSTAWMRVPVIGQYARVHYTVAGSSPAYSVSLRGAGEH